MRWSPRFSVPNAHGPSIFNLTPFASSLKAGLQRWHLRYQRALRTPCSNANLSSAFDSLKAGLQQLEYTL
jgi:hypothetical protein